MNLKQQELNTFALKESILSFNLDLHLFISIGVCLSDPNLIRDKRFDFVKVFLSFNTVEMWMGWKFGVLNCHIYLQSLLERPFYTASLQDWVKGDFGVHSCSQLTISKTTLGLFPHSLIILAFFLHTIGGSTAGEKQWVRK